MGAWWIPGHPPRPPGCTCHRELCARTLLDLRPGGQEYGSTEVDPAVVTLCGCDDHVEVVPIGQLCNLEAGVWAGLTATLEEGSQLLSLVAGAQPVPVQHMVLRPVREAAGEDGICPLGHCESGWGEGEGAPGPAGGL